MNDKQLKLFIKALAINAEVEGMKAENQFNLINGYNIIYGDSEFTVKANELTELAKEVHYAKD